jgi:predicted permease
MDWTARVRSAFGEKAPEPDVLAELADHARETYEAACRDGLSAGEAERSVDALIARWRDEARELRRPLGRRSAAEVPSASAAWIAGAMQDARYAVRLLRRQPGPSFLVIATLAVGIAAATTLFSVTYGVLLRPLVWPTANQVVVLRETREGHAPRFGSLSNAAFLAWVGEAETIDRLAVWSRRAVTLELGPEPERVRATAASAGVFRVLGISALEGVLFDERDETAPVVVLGERLWRRSFGGSADAIGRSVMVDGVPRTVIGVVADRFAFPDRETEAWLPVHVAPVQGDSLSMFEAIALLRAGATPAQAAAEGTSRGRSAPATAMTAMAIFGATGPPEIAAVPLESTLTADVRQPLVLLLVAVGLLLVTATANIAGLQLARATSRRAELAIRAAIGADPARLVRQLLTESLLLGLLGGAIGLALAAWLHRALPALLPSGFPRAADVELDGVVVLVALGLSLTIGLASGVLPTATVRRAGATGTRIRQVIAASQIAITCILLVGASLLGRSFWILIHADRGYEPSGVLTASLSLPGQRFTPERRYEIVDAIVARLSGAPDLGVAAWTSELPLSAGGSTASFTLRSPIVDGESVQASPRIVSAGFFSALRMRLASGRGFDERDGAAGEPVAVVNAAFARRYLGPEPIDTHVPLGVGYMDPTVEARVVGVVDDVRYASAGDATQPEIYYDYRQLRGRVLAPVVTLVMRPEIDRAAAVVTLRAVVREVAPDLALDRVALLDERLASAVSRPRLYAVLLGTFAGFALLVAGVGLFGVLSYTVSERMRELAVRAALGAKPLDLVRTIVARGLGLAVLGLGAGIAASLLLSPAIRALLYGVTEHDAVTFVVVPIVVIAIALLACAGPARRAGRVDPVRELRA